MPTRFIELAGEINTGMPRHVIGRVAEALDIHAGKALSRSKVLVLDWPTRRTCLTFAKARL